MTDVVPPDPAPREVSVVPHAGARRSIRYVGAGLLIAILLYRVDWADAAQQIPQVSLSMLVSAFMVMGVALLISAWKWGWALRLHDMRYPYPFLLRTLCIGFFLNNFLPTAVGGDAYRVVRTLPRDSYRSRALSAVIIERAMGFLALILLGAIGALRLAEYSEVAYLYWYILMVLAMLGATGFFALHSGWLERFTNRWRGSSALNALRYNISLLRNRRAEWLGLIFGSFLFQLVSIGAIFLLFNAVTADATPSQCALIAAAVGVAAALPISVNGVGVMEGAMVAVAVALKLDYEQALIVAFARRTLTLLLAIPCGVLWLTESRYLHRSGNRIRFRDLLPIFRVHGFRGLLRALQPPEPWPGSTAVTETVLTEPDIPLAAIPEGTTPQQWHTELLEYTYDAIVIWEMEGQGILYWNRAAEQLYGYSRHEAARMTTHLLLRTQLDEGVEQLEAKLARYGVWAGELTHTTKFGRQITVQSRLALLSQHNGRWLVLEVNRPLGEERRLSEQHAVEGHLQTLRSRTAQM